MGHVMIHNTRGKDDVERASLAFLVGNTALSSGQEATVLLTIEGVWVATRGYAEGLQARGFAPLSELVQQFASRVGRSGSVGPAPSHERSPLSS
jgi:predicted peroxiredoxin